MIKYIKIFKFHQFPSCCNIFTPLETLICLPQLKTFKIGNIFAISDFLKFHQNNMIYISLESLWLNLSKYTSFANFHHFVTFWHHWMHRHVFRKLETFKNWSPFCNILFSGILLDNYNLYIIGIVLIKYIRLFKPHWLP